MFDIEFRLRAMARRTGTPELLVQKIQIGLGCRKKSGEPVWTDVKPPTYRYFHSMLVCLERKYPHIGWFYAAAKLWKEENPSVNQSEIYRRNEEYLSRVHEDG